MLKLIVILFGSLVFVLNADAAVWNIGASGHDFTTIAAAVQDAGVADGDTIFIADSVHTECGDTITKDLVILGKSQDSTIIQGHASQSTAAERIFYIPDTTAIILQDLLIKHGYANAAPFVFARGGCIYNDGTVSIRNCKITLNNVISSGEAQGGAIYNNGVMDLNFCEINENEAAGYGENKHARGGGIYNNDSLVIKNSTLHDNKAMGGGSLNLQSGMAGNAYGGGIYNNGNAEMSECCIDSCEAEGGSYVYIGGGMGKPGDGYGGGICQQGTGTFRITNTTISSNLAEAGTSTPTMMVGTGMGGGLSCIDGIFLTNITITQNEAEYGGGVRAWHPGHDTFSVIFNTLVSNNIGTLGGNDIVGYFWSRGYNYIQDTSLTVLDTSSVYGNTNDGNLTGGDPLLGLLVNNGGPTRTHALGDGSVAINAGSNTGAPGHDQRGYTRSGTYDIGVFEYGGMVPVVLSGFYGTPVNGGVLLVWNTQSETDNLGFDILRAGTPDGSFKKVNTIIIPGNGNSAQPEEYSFKDINVGPGTYCYQLVQIDLGGHKEYSNVISVTVPATEIKAWVLHENGNNITVFKLYNLDGSVASSNISGIYIIKTPEGLKKIFHSSVK